MKNPDAYRPLSVYEERDRLREQAILLRQALEPLAAPARLTGWPKADYEQIYLWIRTTNDPDIADVGITLADCERARKLMDEGIGEDRKIAKLMTMAIFAALAVDTDPDDPVYTVAMTQLRAAVNNWRKHYG